MLAFLAWTVLAVNVITFVTFGVDKSFAKRDRRRVPEAWLLGLSFWTGLFGGWAAMSTFRHKTRKTSFRWKMIAVTIFNPLWLLVWLGCNGTIPA